MVLADMAGALFCNIPEADAAAVAAADQHVAVFRMKCHRMYAAFVTGQQDDRLFPLKVVNANSPVFMSCREMTPVRCIGSAHHRGLADAGDASRRRPLRVEGIKFDG